MFEKRIPTSRNGVFNGKHLKTVLDKALKKFPWDSLNGISCPNWNCWMFAICAMVKSRYIGDGHLTFNRNPYNGYINPYYWVDDHPLLYGNNGSFDPGTYDESGAPCRPPCPSHNAACVLQCTWPPWPDCPGMNGCHGRTTCAWTRHAFETVVVPSLFGNIDVMNLSFPEMNFHQPNLFLSALSDHILLKQFIWQLPTILFRPEISRTAHSPARVYPWCYVMLQHISERPFAQSPYQSSNWQIMMCSNKKSACWNTLQNHGIKTHIWRNWALSIKSEKPLLPISTLDPHNFFASVFLSTGPREFITSIHNVYSLRLHCWIWKHFGGSTFFKQGHPEVK